MVNQILSVDNSQNSGKGSGSFDIKKVIIFFSIVMIIFSVGIIAKATYSIIDNNNFGSKKAIIETEKYDEDDKILLSVESEEEIARIVYSWSNDEKEIEVKANNQKYIETFIELPLGANTIKVISYDVNGRATEYTKEYVVEAKKPQVSVTAVNGKMVITANDKDKMSYITYRWDDEEEEKVEATAESSAQITKEVEIPRGEHTLYVVAVNSKNLTSETSQQVKGITKPYANVVIDSDDPKMLILSVSDEEAIKYVFIELNGKQYEIDFSNVEYRQQSIQHRLEQQVGENNIKVIVRNFDGAEYIYQGRNVYNP